jgi:hypothetical protein
MLENLTLITCSFNTPEILSTMLKSFVAVHHAPSKIICDNPYVEKYNIIIQENSTNEETSKILNFNNIPYLKNPGGKHSQSVDEALQKCNTKYALLVDTDIIFTKSIMPLLDAMDNNGMTMMGIVQGSRGGYNLKYRVAPWYCLINMYDIKKRGIKFHDQKKIDESMSGYFYQNPPINPNKNNKEPFYDVGATFYEDIKNAGLNIASAKGIEVYFKHYEGSSWHRFSGHKGFMDFGNMVYEIYKQEIEKYKNIDIRNKFK